jgi:hypothetical protein
MTKEDELYVALLIIELGGTFSKTYRLCTLLSRKFEIFMCTEVINGLINNEYVAYEEIEGGKLFFINEKGKAVLAEKRMQIVEALRIDFPKELDLIDHFSNPRS